MKTDNIYYGIVRVSTNVKKEGNYFWDGITSTTFSTGFKPVLVLVKKNIAGKTIVKDLNTNEKYTTVIPLEIGKLFIKMDQMIAFGLLYENIPAKLSKKEVLEIGNKGLEEIRKCWVEELEPIKLQKQKVKSQGN